ncbi:imm11 family protein [Chloroflexus aurantiacus]|jgi:hypothetical protein|nr:MAG: hypothetical protein KatS3mg056_3314 [Chloroflexus sp.]
MRFYDWCATAQETSGIEHLHVQGWKDDFALAQRLREARPFREGEWMQMAPADWSEDGPLTDLLFDPRFHVVSPRLRMLLEELGLGAVIQFLPIRIRGVTSGREIEGYTVANFLQRIPCLDLEQSIGVEFYGSDWIRPEQRGHIAGVWRAALRKDAVGDARVFRVDEWAYIVAIREDVRQAMMAAGITGSYFVELGVV